MSQHPTPRRGPKKPGRHQWQFRPGKGVTVCTRPGCKATKVSGFRVSGYPDCGRRPLVARDRQRARR